MNLKFFFLVLMLARFFLACSSSSAPPPGQLPPPPDQAEAPNPLPPLELEGVRKHLALSEPLQVAPDDWRHALQEHLQRLPVEKNGERVLVPPQAWFQNPLNFSWSNQFWENKEDVTLTLSRLQGKEHRPNLTVLPFAFREWFLKNAKKLPENYTYGGDFKVNMKSGVTELQNLSEQQFETPLEDFHQKVAEGFLETDLSNRCGSLLQKNENSNGGLYFRWAKGAPLEGETAPEYELEMYRKSLRGEDPFHPLTVNAPNAATFMGLGLYLAGSPDESVEYAQIIIQELFKKEQEERTQSLSLGIKPNYQKFFSSLLLDALALSTVMVPKGMPFYQDLSGSGKEGVRRCLSMVHAQSKSVPGNNIREAIAFPPSVLIQYQIPSVSHHWFVLKGARKVLMKPFDGDGVSTQKLAEILWREKKTRDQDSSFLSPLFICSGSSAVCKKNDFIHRFLTRAVSARPFVEEKESEKRRDFLVRGGFFRSDWEKHQAGNLPVRLPGSHVTFTLSGQCGVYEDAQYQKLLALYPVPRNKAETKNNPCFEEEKRLITEKKLIWSPCDQHGKYYFSGQPIAATHCAILKKNLGGSAFELLVATDQDSQYEADMRPEAQEVKKQERRLSKLQGSLEKEERALQTLGTKLDTLRNSTSSSKKPSQDWNNEAIQQWIQKVHKTIQSENQAYQTADEKVQQAKQERESETKIQAFREKRKQWEDEITRLERLLEKLERYLNAWTETTDEIQRLDKAIKKCREKLTEAKQAEAKALLKNPVAPAGDI